MPAVAAEVEGAEVDAEAAEAEEGRGRGEVFRPRRRRRDQLRLLVRLQLLLPRRAPQAVRRAQKSPRAARQVERGPAGLRRDKARRPGNDRRAAEQPQMSPADARRLANSIVSWTYQVRLVARQSQRAARGPAGRQPIFCKAAERASFRLLAVEIGWQGALQRALSVQRALGPQALRR